MTTPDIVSVIAAALAAHQIVRRSNCECGQRLTFAPSKPLKTHTEAHTAHQAHAVLAAIAEAGNEERCTTCGIDLKFPTAAHLIDCPAQPAEQETE